MYEQEVSQNELFFILFDTFEEITIAIPVTFQSFSHLVTQSLGHSFTRSLDYLISGSLGHSITWSPAQLSMILWPNITSNQVYMEDGGRKGGKLVCGWRTIKYYQFLRF